MISAAGFTYHALGCTIDKVFSLEEGGFVREYPGNYSIYLDYKKAEAAQEQAATKETPKIVEAPPKVVENNKKRGISTWEKREYEKLEAKIAQLEVEKAAAEKAVMKVEPGSHSQVQKLYEQVDRKSVV